jgi:2-polyprenyl-3-methyl-5-hydroxy-6-metoxy-1,4-benzoquinol methylase
MTAGYESFEYDRLVERGFRPYSRGHRRMYEKPIAELVAEGWSGRGGVRVLEAGFGIGWGLDQMSMVPGLLQSFVGYEPNKDSFAYVKGRHAEANVLLLNFTFEPNLDPAFDVAFCIEVIEHVPGDHHDSFLRGLHMMAPRLYLSTPCARKKPTEGVRTQQEWTDMLRGIFARVDVDDSEWTTLYTCHRE